MSNRTLTILAASSAIDFNNLKPAKKVVPIRGFSCAMARMVTMVLLRRFLERVVRDAGEKCSSTVIIFKLVTGQGLSIDGKTMVLASRAYGEAAAVRRTCHSQKTPELG